MKPKTFNWTCPLTGVDWYINPNDMEAAAVLEPDGSAVRYHRLRAEHVCQICRAMERYRFILILTWRMPGAEFVKLQPIVSGTFAQCRRQLQGFTTADAKARGFHCGGDLRILLSVELKGLADKQIAPGDN